MSRPKLAICDPDTVYLGRLDEYIRNHINISMDIYSFTEPQIFCEFAEKEEVNLLIVSEKNYWELEDRGGLRKFDNILVLDEENLCGAVCEDDGSGKHIEHISKYQPASAISHAVIDMCSRIPEKFMGLWAGSRDGGSRIIGFYTPLSRSGQTTMAVKAGEILSEKSKTILLSFESFSSLGGLIKEEPLEDITDLLYYAECEKDKFCLYLERIKKTVNGLDFIPPAKTAMQLSDITCDRLAGLIELLSRDGGYEYIILDMKEHPDRFMDMLRMCTTLFTVIRPQAADKYRVRLFESVLEKNGYEDVAGRLVKCTLPDIRDKGAYRALIEELLEREGLTDGLKA